MAYFLTRERAAPPPPKRGAGFMALPTAGVIGESTGRGRSGLYETAPIYGAAMRGVF